MKSQPSSPDPNPSVLPGALSPCGRPSWSGLLQFSLVSIPVKAFPAVSSSEATFHQLHADCGQRIRYEKRCSGPCSAERALGSPPRHPGRNAPPAGRAVPAVRRRRRGDGPGLFCPDGRSGARRRDGQALSSGSAFAGVAEDQAAAPLPCVIIGCRRRGRVSTAFWWRRRKTSGCATAAN